MHCHDYLSTYASRLAELLLVRMRNSIVDLLSHGTKEVRVVVSRHPPETAPEYGARACTGPANQPARSQTNKKG